MRPRPKHKNNPCDCGFDDCNDADCEWMGWAEAELVRMYRNVAVMKKSISLIGFGEPVVKDTPEVREAYNDS